MSDCRKRGSCITPLPVDATDIERWDYVMSFYGGVGNEAIDSVNFSLDLVDYQSYVARTGSVVSFERWLQWLNDYGTVEYGNLPEYKVSDHVGTCSAVCPYDTISSEIRTRIMLGLSDTDPMPIGADHSVGDIHYYMTPEYRGTWGYVCTFENCPYNIGYGQRYFYV